MGGVRYLYLLVSPGLHILSKLSLSLKTCFSPNMRVTVFPLLSPSQSHLSPGAQLPVMNNSLQLFSHRGITMLMIPVNGLSAPPSRSVGFHQGILDWITMATGGLGTHSSCLDRMECGGS